MLVALLIAACAGASRDTPASAAAPAAEHEAGQPAVVETPAGALGAAEPAVTPVEGVASDEDATVPKPPPLTPLGVPECDKFVEKYLACVDVHVPADQQERLIRELHVHRVRWLELEKMQDGKLAAGLSCRGVAQRLKGDLIVDFGCEF